MKPARLSALADIGSVGDDIVHEEPGFVLAVHRNVTVAAWGHGCTVSHVEAMAAAGRRLLSRYPKTSSICSVHPDAAMPKPEGRAALEGIVTASAPYLSRVALLLGGSGFRTSAMRSMLTGIHFAQARQYKTRTFADAQAATAWLVPDHEAETGVHVDADAIVRLIAATATALDRGLGLDSA